MNVFHENISSYEFLILKVIMSIVSDKKCVCSVRTCVCVCVREKKCITIPS